MIFKKMHYIDECVRKYKELSLQSSSRITDIIIKEKYSIENAELHQDDVSLSTNNILGFYYMQYQSGIRKLYALKCDLCAENPVLHGDGIYLVNLSHMKKGILSCGCAPRVNWTEYQHYLKIIEECNKHNYTFLGFKGKYLRLFCHEHGLWESTTRTQFLAGKGCRKCGSKSSAIIRRKGDDEHISNFVSTGIFDLKRTNILDGEGRYRIWEYKCSLCSHDEYVTNGLCSGIFTSFNSDLVKGKKGCRCADNYRWTSVQREFQISKLLNANFPHIHFVGWVGKYENVNSDVILLCDIHGEYVQKVNYLINNHCACPMCKGKVQTECYINMIVDTVPIALKYGISKFYETRLESQSRKSIFDVENVGVWDFDTPYLCKMAENECKRMFNSVLSDRELPDGYTETAEIRHIDKIIDIYESWGGVKRT